MTPEEIKQRQDFAMEQNITTLRNRVNELGVSEPIVAQQGRGSHRRTVSRRARIRIRRSACSARRRHSSSAWSTRRTIPTRRSARSALRPARSSTSVARGRARLLKREVIVSGDQLTDATSGFAEGQPAVNVRLDERGGKQMLKTTQENLGRRMAVVYIEKKRVAEGEPCKGVRDGNGAPKRK